MSDMPVLEVQDLVVAVKARTLLEVPRFLLSAGEIVALVGPNGAGKSTFLRAVGLLDKPARGTVAIGGAASSSQNALALRRRMAMVFQAPLLFDRDVLANASAGLRFRGLGRREAERQAMVWLERFGVAGLAQRGVRQLSGGEAQRVSLARAFATEPVLLLLDEPFSALDAPTRAELVPELLRWLRETRTAALLVTHDIGEAARADRIVVLDGGRVIQTGTIVDLRTAPSAPIVTRLFGPATA